MSKFLRNFIADESGATAIEYGLIAALIAVVLIASISVLGEKVGGIFDKVGTAMPQ